MLYACKYRQQTFSLVECQLYFMWHPLYMYIFYLNIYIYFIDIYLYIFYVASIQFGNTTVSLSASLGSIKGPLKPLGASEHSIVLRGLRGLFNWAPHSVPFICLPSRVFAVCKINICRMGFKLSGTSNSLSAHYEF